MSREWCPTLVSNSRLLDTAHGGKTCEISSPNNADIARENGAVAANSDVSAHKFASTLRDRIRDNCPKFRACVVASKINKDFWPIAVRHTCFVYDDDFRPKPDAAVSLGGRFMFELLHTESSVQNVVLPSDQIIKFLDDVARREAKVKSHSFSSNAYNLVLLPTLGKNASLDSILGCISGNHRLLESLKSLSVCTATASEEAAITAFSEKAKKLTGVSYARCALRNCAIGAFQAWKESTIEQVNVEGNDLGTNMEDGMHEEIAASIAEFVKYNKFLLKLNLAHNNFNGEAISSVMQSLFKSDTVLLPDDLPPEPEEDDPPVEEYIDRSLFIPSDEDEEDEMTEEEEEEEEEAEASDASASNEEMEEEPAASLKKTKKKRRSSDSDEESDEDEDDEEESEGDGNDEGNGSDDGEEDSEEDEEDDGPKVDPKIARKYARLFKRLLRDEGRLRRECVLEYLDSLLVTISEIDAIRARRDDEKRRAIEAFCERRSGWSHLQTLILRGNPIGDRATAEVASTLKDEVLLEDEEIERIENKLRDGVSVLLEDHQSDRRQTMVSEMKEWRMLTSEARREQKSISYNATDHPVFPDEMEDDDEYERNAPPVVLTNDGMDEGDEEFDEELPELDNDWEEDRESWNIPVEPKKSGMNTLRYLDLGSCEVGSRGVKALATVLMTNTVLETLILRNNSKIGTMFKKIVDENSDDDDGDTAPRKVEVPHYISPGFGAFTDMLRTNSSLRQLDLGYCQLSPDAIRILGAALAANESIVTLCMEGNRFVETAPEDAVTATLQPSESALLSFLHGVEKSSVQHLSLSHNDLASCIWQEEVDALASLSKKLSSLYLTSVGMTADHISKWAAALSNDQESVVETLHIARNSFHSQQCGQAIATLLSQFPQLKELCIDDHPKLGSAGLGAALATAPSTLVRLSCDRTGVSAKRYAGQLVLEPKLCSQLEYLCLSDTNISTYEELQEWAVHLSEHCHKLQFLSIWTRRLDMEPNLEPLRALVEAIPSLQHIDFGVLLRFDVSPDYTDDLGAIEKALVNRRLAQHEVRIEPPATTELPEPTVAQQSE